MPTPTTMTVGNSQIDRSPFIQGLIRTGASESTLRIAREVVRRQEEEAQIDDDGS